ncbi:MAG: hypothetical protein K8R92_02940 [Planctomycetes bacterium]|nr:hypothetical protein [Planctomycetota bacterium]
MFYAIFDVLRLIIMQGLEESAPTWTRVIFAFVVAFVLLGAALLWTIVLYELCVFAFGQ